MLCTFKLKALLGLQSFSQKKPEKFFSILLRSKMSGNSWFCLGIAKIFSEIARCPTAISIRLHENNFWKSFDELLH